MRDKLLSETDFYVQIPDYPITQEKRTEYLTYRQQLRDLPETITGDIDDNNLSQYFPQLPN